MERRKALKNMGLALGYTIATPTLLGIVQSCKGETPAVLWQPDFFTADQGSALTKLVDIILPATDTPSASESNVHLFIDKFAHQVMDAEQQGFVKLTMDKFLGGASKAAGVDAIEKLSAENLEAALASSLKISKDQQKLHDDALTAFKEAMLAGETPTLADDVASYSFASQLRGLTIWGFKSSEYIGEKVLAYLPIPGEYVPCGDLQELTEGKAWSL